MASKHTDGKEDNFRTDRDTLTVTIRLDMLCRWDPMGAGLHRRRSHKEWVDEAEPEGYREEESSHVQIYRVTREMKASSNV